MTSRSKPPSQDIGTWILIVLCLALVLGKPLCLATRDGAALFSMETWERFLPTLGAGVAVGLVAAGRWIWRRARSDREG